MVGWGAGWGSGRRPLVDWVCAAKTRYRPADTECVLPVVAGSGFEVAFAEPQWAVTPGQSVVVYESKVCLGGGIIA